MWLALALQFWKVGAWTWEWMEPAIGTASFVLLAMQLIRSQVHCCFAAAAAACNKCADSSIRYMLDMRA